MNLFTGIMIPFIGTMLGAACVFFMKNEMKPLVQKGLLGFASGVMIAASVWSLLIPSMEMSEEMGRFAFVPAAGGFLLGIAFLLLMDRLVPHLHLDSDSPEGVRSGLKKSTMLVFAVPLVGTGMSKMRAFVYGTLSGAVEPVGAVLTICLASYIEPVLTYLLAFAAGAMDVCGCGGTDPGNGGRRAFEYCDDWVCGRIYAYDGAGYGARIK